MTCLTVFLPIRFAMTVMICMIGVMRVGRWFSPAQMDESQQARDSQGDQVKPSRVVPGKPRVRDCAGGARTVRDESAGLRGYPLSPSRGALCQGGRLKRAPAFSVGYAL